MEGTFERHVRLVDSVYENSIYSIATCDVMVIDALHLGSTVIIKALDAVCRRVRGRPQVPFGGLRILASADFWEMHVHPASDHGGYVFQLPEWDELFPVQRYLEHIHGQDRSLGRITDSALMGTLTGSETKQLMTLCADSALASERQFVKVIDTSTGMFHFRPRFPKQPSILHNPNKAVQIKRVEIGNFLINMLYQSAFAERYGMIGSLSLEVGTKVHLIYPLLHRGGHIGDIDIPAGVCGEVIQIYPHRITVSFPTLHRTVDIPRVRIAALHTNYPELTYATEQFPLFPRSTIVPKLIVDYGTIFNVDIDGRMLADTNDLGNILSRMRNWDDFRITNVKDFLRLEGVVHEPTRVYYCKLRNQPVSSSSELWCRNCKGHVPTDTFHEHWRTCITSVRWCSECDTTVPLTKLEAHMEKHQIVLCIDCGQPIEWRYWEHHRLTCAPMMRELSSDNPFLPEVTRKFAVELGLDKRDLHTVKQLNRSMLPKSKHDVLSKQIV